MGLSLLHLRNASLGYTGSYKIYNINDQLFDVNSKADDAHHARVTGIKDPIIAELVLS